MGLADDLRKSVLQAAIQGKLVPQDPHDEPANVLLERIQGEKEKLIVEKKIKKEKPLEPIKEDEIPFDIPDGWQWVRMNDVVISIQDGDHQPPPQTDDGTPFLVISNISAGYLDFSNTRYVKKEYYENLSFTRKPEMQDVLFTVTGSYGISVMIDTQRDFCFQRHMALIKVGSINSKYIKWLTNSFLVKEQCDRLATGIAQKTVSISILRNLIVPLPPLTEQERIVFRIEELMTKIDEFASIEKELESLKKSFPEDLKKSLLQAAIQGKLTKQLSTDSSIDDLFDKIKKEKQQLIKDKKIKKEKDLPPISEDEIPFDIPKNWRWVRLGDLGFTNIGLTYKPSDISEEGTIVLRSSNVQAGKLHYEDIVRVSNQIPDTKMCQVGDILICARNGSKRLVGKAALIDNEGMSFGAFMAIFRSQFNDYIINVINSPHFRNTLLGDAGTTTINQITQDMLKNFVIPFPPIEEQHRIIEKIEALLPLCEELVLQNN